MRFVSTLVHGIADYVVGMIVLGLPFYYGLTGSQRMPFVVLGVFVIIYSFFTVYEAGLVRFLRLRFHLLLDALFGVAMLFIPSLLNLPAVARTPVYAISILALLLAVTTKVRAEGTHSHSSIWSRP